MMQHTISNPQLIFMISIVNQSDIVLGTDLPPSGSNQEYLKYLWCTPGTKTYVYFGFGSVTGTRPLPYYNFYEAFVQAEINVANVITDNGTDSQITNNSPGYWTMNPSSTNVELWVQSSVGTMTYGILGAALTGLEEAAVNYNKGNYPMIFQINDGQWGEVGIGYAGLLDAYGGCYYQIAPDNTKGCNDIANGWVQGFN